MDRRGVRTEQAVAGGPGAGTAPDDSARVQTGQLIGRYRLLFPIAAGGMAEVWAAKPEGTGISRAVALKLVRPEFAAEAEYARMFIDEAVIASTIRHPNICETYELGRDANLLFMVMEWVAGDTLSGLMRGAALTALPLEIAARICAEACAGLHAAHEAKDGDGNSLGIVHRDISPPNILVSMNGHVKVSDFGIAKAANQLHARTRTGEIKGKLAYIPPEQVLGHGVDRRVDVYAMGCVLYVTTLGRRPFGSGGEALGKIVRGSYRKPRELEPDYPEELERIVMRALASDREQRYQTAEEMRFELEQWLLTRPHLTQHSDVARLVRERISEDRKKMIDALMNVSRAVPDALANRFISPADKTATPTATSGIVVQPAALARLQSQASLPGSSLTPTPANRPSEDDETLLSDAGRPGAVQPAGSALNLERSKAPWLIALAVLALAALLFLLSR
ncbi:MAG TPA: serine/threonine-protein kinase [Polyangiaceae bacterium]|nr:serine/threonine-protein kinase [Polyangiaceae bacterium]